MKRSRPKPVIYNPLDKINLAKSIEIEILRHDPIPLGDVGDVIGAGVYAIYYAGRLAGSAKSRPPIETVLGSNRSMSERPSQREAEKVDRRKTHPRDRPSPNASANMLVINEATNLSIDDFQVRHLVVDDVWIPLGENILIETFKPVFRTSD